MKKIIAVVLALVLSVAMMVPANAAGSTYMIFACETDDGCGSHPIGFGVRWGAVAENSNIGHPAPVQGDFSYCMSTKTGAVGLYHNLNHSPGVTTTGTFNATNWEYIEFDVYCSVDVVADFQFGLCTDTADPQGAAWGLNSAWIPQNRWYHIKMPISEFGSFPASFGGSMSNINRIKIQFTNVVVRDNLMEGDFITPEYAYFYFDNVIATTGDAGQATELIDFDTLMNDPPEWFPEYEENRNIIPPPPPPPEILYGDANLDGEVTSGDALSALQHGVGKIVLESMAFTSADVNLDTEVTSGDALLILQYAVGKIDAVPRE